jgi:uncharacterized protein (DUF2141 family)
MMMKILVNTIILLFISIVEINAQDIEVNVKGIRSEKGQISIGVFRDDATFQKEKAFQTLKFKKTGISKGEMTLRFSLEPGTYGLALLDDENNNGKMEYNFLGIPKEGFGFSDYYLKGLKKPKFDSFKFSVERKQKLVITIKIRYM